MNTFDDLQLNEKIIKTLNSIGFSIPTPIQLEAIPVAIQGQDIIASAQTGTGKTGAFLLPALHTLAEMESEKIHGPKVLILVPTRELAEQVSKEAVRFSKHLHHIKTVCIYGGMPYPQQNRALSRPYHILVATPGRLLDHLERGRIDLSNLSYFVLDEADRMLDMGFVNDVETIASHAPESRQTLLFSATIDRNVMKISQKLQNNPYRITVEADKANEANIDQKLYYVDNINHKVRLLESLLEDPELKQAIVFTSTKSQADKLSYELQDKGYDSAPLHGDINQRKRNDTLKKLRMGRIQILVATDIAARGIDITDLSHVINFDVPRQAEDFVHRIGRTGRAGATGTAITFATYGESKMLEAIDRLTGKEMAVCTIDGMEPAPRPKGGFSRDTRGGKRFGRGGGMQKSFTPRWEKSGFGPRKEKRDEFPREKRFGSESSNRQTSEREFGTFSTKPKRDNANFGERNEKRGEFSKERRFGSESSEKGARREFGTFSTKPRGEKTKSGFGGRSEKKGEFQKEKRFGSESFDKSGSGPEFGNFFERRGGKRGPERRGVFKASGRTRPKASAGKA